MQFTVLCRCMLCCAVLRRCTHTSYTCQAAVGCSPNAVQPLRQQPEATQSKRCCQQQYLAAEASSTDTKTCSGQLCSPVATNNSNHSLQACSAEVAAAVAAARLRMSQQQGHAWTAGNPVPPLAETEPSTISVCSGRAASHSRSARHNNTATLAVLASSTLKKLQQLSAEEPC